MTKTQKTYRELNQELEEALEALQSDSLELEENIKNYNRAMEIIGELESQLKTAQNEIKKIKIKTKQT